MKYDLFLQIDVDFKTLYSNCSDIKYAIEEKFDVLFKLLKEQIKDTESKKMLEYYEENKSNISESNYIILNLGRY